MLQQLTGSSLFILGVFRTNLIFLLNNLMGQKNNQLYVGSKEGIVLIKLCKHL